VFELTRHPDPKVRRRAVVSACSRHTKADYPQVWDCLLAVSRDPDSKVRSYVLHNLVDGSPSSRKDEVVAALEKRLRIAVKRAANRREKKCNH
jgi:hypothetical protein